MEATGGLIEILALWDDANAASDEGRPGSEYGGGIEGQVNDGAEDVRENPEDGVLA